MHAFDHNRALLVSAGQPARIYRTENGGSTWTLVHESPHPAAFFDAIVFWDALRGMVFSDPVDGHFLLLHTADGGRTWRELETAGLPAPLPGEGGFAASGTMMAALPPDHLWIATSHHGRILASRDGGAGWTVTVPPMARGSATCGVFSLAFRDPLWGVAVGGDYQAEEARDGTAAWTEDGGRTWHPCEQALPGGYRSGAAFQPGTGRVVAVGHNGSDWSADGGRTWRPLGTGRYHGVAFSPAGEGWAAGPQGRKVESPGSDGEHPLGVWARLRIIAPSLVPPTQP